MQRAMERQRDTAQSRILVVSMSADASGDAIPLMNAIFSAQKMNVPVDVCRLIPSKNEDAKQAVFLEQAAHITGGSYVNAMHSDGLYEYLIVSSWV